ncbi:MAG TPA: hypothetical protein VGH93_14525, partial [Solirubrobacteraceae bacterium]
IMFPAPLMSTIEEIGSFLSREAAAAVSSPAATDDVPHDDTALVTASTQPPTNGTSGGSG